MTGPSREQINSSVRWLITMAAGVVAGWFAAKGYLDYDTVYNMMTSEAVIGMASAGVAGLVSLILGQKASSEKSLTASTQAIPGVQVLAPPKLAEEVPGVIDINTVKVQAVLPVKTGKKS